MTIATVVAKLQAINATVTGINKAPTVMPASLNTADLPMALTIPAEGRWNPREFAQSMHVRTYVVRVYVGPVGQDTVDEAFTAALPIMQAMGVKYLANPNLDGTVYDTEITDSGLDGRLLFAGNEYRGFEFRILVTELL